MDHLIIPNDAQHIEVPYLCSEPFQGALSDYPERNQWTRHELEIDPEFGGKHPDAILPFLQNYLFLGTLARLFEIYDIAFDVREWSRPGRDGGCSVVTTAALLGALSSLEANVTGDDLSPGMRNERLGMAGDLLNDLHAFVTGRFGQLEDYLKRSGIQSRDWPLIALSVTVLGWTLEFSMERIYLKIRDVNQADFKRHKWKSGFLDRRMEAAGWSQRDLSWDGIIGLDGHYFVGFLECPRRHQNCQNCQDPKCSRKFLNDDDYIVRHVPGCAGDCAMWEVSDQVARVLKDGHTPLVSWDESKVTVVDASCEDSIYVAISHVYVMFLSLSLPSLPRPNSVLPNHLYRWSDGMGNPKANALPSCVLSSIQSMVDNLYSIPRPDQKRMYLLFGPRNPLGPRDPNRKPVGFWMDTLCVPVHDIEAKNQAIADMRTVYEWADRTLVLDAWTRELPIGADITERASRLVLSNWQSRLWTLQEGVLAHNLFIQFQDEACPLESLREEWQMTEKDRPGLRFYSSFGNALGTVPLLRLSFPSRPPMNRPLRFTGVIGGMHARTTTKRSDETVCIATMLEINPKPLLDIPGKKKPDGISREAKTVWESKTCDERMEKLLQIIGSLNARILFSNLPRMKTEGFRWAPRSYIDRPNLEVAGHKSDRTHKLDDAVVKPDRGGVSVKCAGMILSPLGLPTTSGAFSVEDCKKFQFTLTLKPEEDDDKLTPPALSGDIEYVVLSYIGIPEDDQRPQRQTEAILGILEAQDHSEGTIRFACMAEMRWHPEEDNHSQLPTVSGRWAKKERWCIK
ncbi:hypothetical protein BJX76DRAFT_362966 [Aspergillus varians]